MGIGRLNGKYFPGVVTTARITHATPGATYAHSPHRDWEADSDQTDSQKNCDDIAKQLIYSDPGNKINVSECITFLQSQQQMCYLIKLIRCPCRRHENRFEMNAESRS